MPKGRLTFAGPVPFGLNREKPRHLRDTLAVAWENRGKLGYAWRVLSQGVCDGCSLGPRGLKDDVTPGLHLCTTRLRLMRLNTMDAFDPATLPDLATLRAMSGAQLQALGRLGVPLAFGPGDTRLRQVSWDEALDRTAAVLRAAPPERLGFFATSRGLTNEAYYAIQKLARLAGTNNVDLCSRLCHAASVSGLEATIGVGAPTCSLSDFIGTDLLVIWGSNIANNQPVTMKYLVKARQAGTRIFVVNPVREPGLEAYWVPSMPLSALFGTRLADRFFQVRVGGDQAFIAGVLKALVAAGQVDAAFIEAHTTGFAELVASLDAQPWAALEEGSGLARSEMEAFAEAYDAARTAVLVYSMGLTQHAFGTRNVRAIANLALSRGNLGRPKTGIMPIRGHSGVQGGGECGVSPVKLPGSQPLTPENRAKFGEAWGRPVPERPGLAFGQLLGQAHATGLDLLYLVGGNLWETMPDPDFMAQAMGRIGLRVHQDIVLNTGTLLAPGEGGEVLILPARTRYEQEGGGTSTNTERRIRFTPYIPGHDPGEARAEWWIPGEIGRRAFPDAKHFASTPEIRAEMGRLMPMYAGIEKLKKAGDWVQWGGPQLCPDGAFAAMPDGRARFTPATPESLVAPDGRLHLSTRRGKQFNSMVYPGGDPLTGARRDDAFLIGAVDALRLGLSDGDAIVVTSDLGRMEGVAKLADIAPGHVQGYWPKANRLIGQVYDPVSGQPDYNAWVTIARANGPG